MENCDSSIDASRKQEEKDFHDKREQDHNSLSEEEFNKKYSNKKWYATTEKQTKFIDDWIEKNLKNKVALDFGCGLGNFSLRLAKAGAQVFSIDISPESVEATKALLKKNGFSKNCTAQVMDAENMTFEDNKFDFVVCSGVLHHMDVNQAFPGISRVLKPSGTVMAIEALGYNPIINLYRQLTPKIRTAWEKDHILTHKELDIARKYFGKVKVNYFFLTSILATPFRNTRIFRPTLKILNALDEVLLRIPILKLAAWQMVFFLEEPTLKKK